MPTHIAITKVSTIDHLDSNSAVHAKHKVLAEEARAKRAERERDWISFAPPGKLKFPCLQGGLLLRPDCSIMSSFDHRFLLKRLVKDRAFYFREEMRADGRARLRKIKTRSVRNLALTFRPDFSAFLASRAEGRDGDAVRAHVIACAKVAMDEFKAATGLEVVAAEIHPESGNLHLHISYCSVDGQNRLLWPATACGRKGLRMAGAWHVGTLRLARAGYLSDGDARLAETDLRRAVRRHGVEPIDWALAQTLDEQCERFVATNGLDAEFNQHATAYRAGLLARRARSPRGVAEFARTADMQRQQALEEIRSLRSRLNAANRLLLSGPGLNNARLGAKTLVMSL